MHYRQTAHSENGQANIPKLAKKLILKLLNHIKVHYSLFFIWNISWSTDHVMEIKRHDLSNSLLLIPIIRNPCPHWKLSRKLSKTPIDRFGIGSPLIQQRDCTSSFMRVSLVLLSYYSTTYVPHNLSNLLLFILIFRNPCTRKKDYKIHAEDPVQDGDDNWHTSIP